MPIYDVDKIENLYDDFSNCYKKFKTNEYDDFNKGYLFSTSEGIIKKLRNRISELYSNIYIGYKNIDKFWKEYLEDIKGFDNTVSGNGSTIVNDGSVKSLVSQLNGIDLDYDEFKLGRYAKSAYASSFASGLGSDLSDAIANVLLRTGASILNIAISLVSGILKFGEAIVDAAVTIVGLVVSLVIAIFPGITFNEVFNSVLKYVSFDSTEYLKDQLYSTTFGECLNDASWAWAKKDGLIYGVGEGIGYVTGVVVLTIATFGTGGALVGVTSSVQIGSGIVAGTAAFGKATQSGYNKKVNEVVKNAAKQGIKLDKDEVLLTNKQIASVMANSTLQAGIEGVTFAATYGKGVKANGNIEKVATEKIAGITKESWVKAGIQASKEYAKDFSEAQFITGWDDFDLASTSKDAVLSAGVSVAYDTLGIGKKVIDSSLNKKLNITDEIVNAKAKEIMKQNAIESADDAVKESVEMGVASSESISGMSDFAKMVTEAKQNEIPEEIIKTAKDQLKKEFVDSSQFNQFFYEGSKKTFGSTVKNPTKDITSWGIEKVEDLIEDAA